MRNVRGVGVVIRVAAITLVGTLAVNYYLSDGHQVLAADPTPTSDSTSFEEAMSFRVRFGLRTDDAYVKGSLVNEAFSKKEWGVPLSAAEIADLNRRVEIQNAIDPAFAAAQSFDTSGGAYIDPITGSIPVFLTTEDPAAFAKKGFVDLIPGDITYRVEQVRFSISELYSTQAQVDADWAGIRKSGIDVASTAIDVIHNRVLVGIRGQQGGEQELLQDRFGGAISVEEELPSQGGDDCTSRAACPPMKGGIQIYLKDEPLSQCTTGFIGRRSTYPVDLRVITAGHCIEIHGGVGGRWRHSTFGFGTALMETWGEGSNADVGLIDIDDENYPSIKNQFYASGADDLRGVTTLHVSADQHVTDYVCRSGEQSGYQCGYIVLINKTMDVDGKQIDHQWVMDSDACKGDSGAPYFLANSAWGIHSDSTEGCNPGTNQAWYSPVDWVLTKLNSAGWPTSFCLRSDCQ